jgi:hypothetical protein
MPPTTSRAAVVVRAPVTPSGVRLALPVVSGSPFGGVGLRHALDRLLWVLGGFGEVLIVAYAFPLVILAIGIPVALLARLVAGTVTALWPL